MNRIATIILCLLSAATATAQKAVDWNDLLTVIDENKRTVYYNRESNTVLKGDFRIKRGFDVEVVKLKNGVIDGEYHRYRSGELRESGRYVNGKREGVFTEYHPGGKVVRKTTPMTGGRIDGTVKTFFSNGNPDIEKEYHNGEEHGAERRYDSATGQQTFQTHYINGKKDGEEWEEADNGNGTKSRIVRHYRAGKLNGAYRNELTRNGELIYLIEGEYSDGKKSGRWVETNYESNTTTASWYGEGGA